MKQSLAVVITFIVILVSSSFAQPVKAPNFSLKTYDGKVVDLAKLKGNIVVVNFWATWCPPCRNEIPYFIKTYETYKSRKVVFVGIALDETGWRTVKPFVDKAGITYPVALGDTALAQRYGGIEYIPTTFLVDQKGMIVGARQGPLQEQELIGALDKLLKNRDTSTENGRQ